MNFSIDDIIKKAGGVAAISKAVHKTDSAVHKWKYIGIPDRHWPVLIEMAGNEFGPAELHEANLAVREQTRRAS